MFSIKDIVDIAIQIEQNGERIYRDAANKIKDLSLSSLLQWLADEEGKHLKWFTALKDKVPDTGDHSEQEKIGRALLRNAVGTQSFTLKDADFSTLEQVEDLIRLSIEFEKDTILFYKMLQPLIEDREALDQLHEIIKEEEKHIQSFKELPKQGKA
ncbi:MAG: ferritin family protein [Deltaproteobacteria bacterium]|jgi:rubrerythrin|nr:ferritin family protein [Deltaproteobacteria bacterium]